MNGKTILPMKKAQKWVLCFLAVFFLFSVSLSAQSQYYPDLVSESTAETMLVDELPTLENAMNSLPPGSLAFQLAERTYLMYMHAWEGVVQGRYVEDALTDTYGEFAIDSNGNDLSQDEMPLNRKSGTGYGDPAFDSLVAFLTL